MSRLYVSFVDLASYIDEEAALRLCDLLGGSSVWVPEPTRIHAGLPLVQAIGKEAAHKLAVALQAGAGGISIDIPISNAASRGLIAFLRRRAIVRFLSAEQPLTDAQIARHFHVTERHVRHIKHQWRLGLIEYMPKPVADTRQLKLFG